jgi:hypothetical protein
MASRRMGETATGRRWRGNAQRSRRAHGIYETHKTNGNQTHKSYWSYKSHSVAEPTIPSSLNPAYTPYSTLLVPRF